MGKVWNPATGSWEETNESERLWDPSSGNWTTQNDFNKINNTITAEQKNNAINTSSPVDFSLTKEERKKNNAVLTSTPIDTRVNQLNTEKKNKEDAYQNYKNNLRNNSLLTIPVLNSNQQRLNDLAARQQFENNYDNSKINQLIKDTNTYQDKLTLENVGKGLINLPMNAAIGTAKTIEFMSDLSVDMGSRLKNWAAVKTGLRTEEEAQKSREKTREYIKRDIVDEGLKALGWDDKMWKQMEDNSLVTRDNIAGQVAQGIGGMFPSIVAGNILPPGSDKMTKIEQLVRRIPSSVTLGVKVMGSGLEEAFRGGATDDQAMKYAIASTAVELGTEWLTGGIPGVQEGGILDSLEEKTLNKVSSKMAKFFIKNGYSVLGEGAEEAISEMLNPIIKNATYTEGEKIDWYNVFNSALVGGITGGLLNIPDNIRLSSSTNNQNNVLNQENIQNPVVNDSENISNNTSNAGINNNNLSVNNNVNNYQYVESDNAKINNLRQDMAKYWKNTDDAISLGNVIEKVITDKNYNIRLDDTIMNNNGQKVNAQIKTVDGEVEIRINPNSQNVGEFLLTHEITHAIETPEMKSLIMNYASKHADFNQALESLKQTYGVDDVSSEVVADISAQLFGNQEFINNLSIEKPSVFRRIYNKIIELANKITGNTKESLFINELKNKWEDAYRTQSNNLSGTTYSIQMDMDGNRYVNIDTAQNLFEGKSPSEQVKIARKYILDNFRESGIDFENENINVTSKTANEYTHPKNQLPKVTKESKMKASTELDNLLNVSEYKYSSKDDGRHSFAKDGWDYYKTIFKVGDKTFTGLINVAKTGNKKTLYDITNIKRISQNRSISAKAFSTSLANSNNDNISQFNKNVKSPDTLSTKYSIQNNKNDTSSNNNKWQQYLDDNYKNTGTKTELKDIKVNKSSSQKMVNKTNELSLKDYIEKRTETLIKDVNKSQKDGKVTNSIKLLLDGGISVEQLKNSLNRINNNPMDSTTLPKLESSLRNKLIDDYENYVKQLESPNKKTILADDKIKNNEKTMDQLKKNQQEVLNRLDEKIKAKESLYNSKSNKDTKIAQQIQQQIALLNNQKNNRQMEYEQRINKLSEVNKNLKEKMDTPEFKTLQQRLIKVNEYRDLAYDMTENMIDWKDKKRGISYQINTMKRNLYDIMSYQDATKMYNTYFKPISDNNAASERFINSYNDRIKKLNLNNVESTAVQMLGEYKYNKETLLTGGEVTEFINKNNLDYNKIDKAVNEFRTIYDELIVKTNEVLIEQGFKPIEYRKGYFPHFVEEKAQTKFGKVLDKMGFKINKGNLPTSIAGITDTFKPGKTWFRNSQRRLGKYTDYNALKGFDSYIRGAADTIFHTEDIQKLRALENVIRYQYTDQSIQDRINEINNDEFLSHEEKTAQFNEVLSRFNNPLGNFATELRNYTDSLANKKSIGDRAIEHALGRETYSIMSNVQSRVSANMVGFNISSALTNFIPITQAYSQVSTKNMLKAIRETISSQHVSDNVSTESTFLTNRNNQSERLYQTKLDNINKKASVLFEGIDDFTSNVIVRGKLHENLDKGMSYKNALSNADEFARDIMAGRDKGSMPTIFNQKNPIVKLFTAFQLEVNNQYGYMLKDLPRDKRNEGLNKLVSAFLKMFVGAWLYNKLSESVTGRKSAFSPIDIVEDAVKTTQNENLNSFEKLSSIINDSAGELPFIGGLLGGGRLPISGALPSISTTTESLLNLADDKKRKAAINTLSKELSKPLFYIVPPFGGGQLKKTVEGLSMYVGKDIPGSYTTSGRLRFEADRSAGGIVKSAIFGQYASKNAKEYFDKGYLPLPEKQQKEIKDLKISVSEYRKYRDDYSEINKIKADKDKKGKSIAGSALGKKAYTIMQNEKISDKEKNYLLQSISPKSPVTVKMLNQLEKNEDTYKYFYSLNNEQKEEFIGDMNAYKFNSKELYDYYNYCKYAKNNYAPVIAKQNIANYLLKTKLTSDQKKYLYSKKYGSDTLSKVLNIFNVNGDNYLNVAKYAANLKDNFEGEHYSNYRKKLLFNYINSLDATTDEKIVLFRVAGYKVSSYKDSMYNYITSTNLNWLEQKEIFEYLF